MNRIIQFIHPGFQTKKGFDKGLQVGNIKPWRPSNISHTRSLINIEGDILNFKEGNNKIIKKKITIVNEWEAESKVLYNTGNKSKPPFLVYEINRSQNLNPIINHFNNTDPFVYGNRFYYFNCKMKGQMLKLNRNDIILFGYRKNSNYYLDTCFVVNDKFDISNNKNNKNFNNFKKGNLTSKLHSEVSINPTDHNQFKVLYNSIMYNDNKTIFSFIPICKNYNDKKSPLLNNLEFINPNLPQGKKITTIDDEDVILYFNKILKEIIKQNFEICIKVY